MFFNFIIIASSYALTPKNVLFLGKNFKFYEKFQKNIIETNINSKMDYNDNFTKYSIISSLKNNDYNYIIANEVKPDIMGEILESMNKHNTNNLISLSKESFLNIGINSVEGLCKHFNISYCDLKYNSLTEKDVTEIVGVDYDKSIHFYKSYVSEKDLVDFCNECILDMKNPYLNETIYVKSSQKNDFEKEIAENNDIISKYAEWFGLFPKEKKWKNVRFTIYSIISGYLLADFVSHFFNPELTDFWE